jgi:hypothetical protein
VVQMATTGDGGMERVDLYGHVDGIQLEPGTSKPVSIKPPTGLAAPSIGLPKMTP